MRRRLGSWNRIRGLWETGVVDLLSEHSEPFSATWPISGSMRSGAAFERLTPEPLMDASASSSSLDLLPTPVVTDSEQSRRATTTTGRSHTGTSLTDALLPTPAAADRVPGRRTYARGNPTLEGALLPTPTVVDMGRGKTLEEWAAWTAGMQAKHGNGNGHGASLEIEALRLAAGVPTQPPSSDGSE